MTVAEENRARRRLDRDAADIAGADLLEEDVDEGTGRRPELLRHEIEDQSLESVVAPAAQGREIGRNMGKISGGEVLARLGVAPTERSP